MKILKPKVINLEKLKVGVKDKIEEIQPIIEEKIEEKAEEIKEDILSFHLPKLPSFGFFDIEENSDIDIEELKKKEDKDSQFGFFNDDSWWF